MQREHHRLEGNWRETQSDDRLSVLDKVLHSRVFSRSDSSQQILKFIVERVVSGRCDDLKEYTIATEAMGRPSDFDPKSDSSVRIQVQRLRRRLEEYYNEEGKGDTVQITIPHGHYVPEFRSSASTEPIPPIQESTLPPESNRPPAVEERNLLLVLPWGLTALLLIVAVIMGIRLSQVPTPKTSLATAAAADALPSSLVPLWNPFCSPDVSLIIVYSNALMLSDDHRDLYWFSPSSAHSLPAGARVQSFAGLERSAPVPLAARDLFFNDLYTGTGEVVAIAEIARRLAIEHQEFAVERARLVSYDNIRNSNAIFVGGGAGDAILDGLPVKMDLDFTLPKGGYGQVVDRRPAAGQPGQYALSRNDKTGEFQADYALISLLPGVTPDRHIMVLAGITTLGTQAAAEFATSPAHMAVLEKMRHASNPVRSPYFQALLEVLIRNGAVAQINCLLTRELGNK